MMGVQWMKTQILTEMELRRGASSSAFQFMKVKYQLDLIATLRSFVSVLSLKQR